MSTVVAAGEVLKLEGNLSYETIPAVLEETAQFAARADLPENIRIDFAGVTGVDSAAVALLLEWRRMALARGKVLVFENLPPNLLSLAGLYGVAELIQETSPS
ncbi:MAG TPA: STAS domain-containing protein [Usitatibacter sp.]|nr:STAS domain-containing protein [Usitatibacter sp.]